MSVPNNAALRTDEAQPALSMSTARQPATPVNRTSALLAAHVPLSLLLDIADPTGPHSRDLLTAEPGSADWLAPAAGLTCRPDLPA